MQQILERVLSSKKDDTSRLGLLSPSPDYTAEGSMAKEVQEALLERAQDVTESLRSLRQVHEEVLVATVEQQAELLQVAKSIDRSLTALADAATALVQTGTTSRSREGRR